ncbi:MAG: hypothetical protein DBY04_03530 [Clostridiales bacterium]|nr:MAG: hypothetical protein DBY04_03530 [Clostridiales bacterium]
MSIDSSMFVRIPPQISQTYCNSISTVFGKIGVMSNLEIDLSNYFQPRYILDDNEGLEGYIVAIQDSKLFSDLGISRFPEAGGFILKDSVGFSNDMGNKLYQIYNRQIIVNHIPFRSIIDFSLDNNSETVICPDKPTLQYLIPSAIRNVVNVCANKQGYMGIHCAAVEKNGCVYLIVGRGRSGKSTLYINLLEKGMNPLNDDLVFVLPEGEDIIVKSVPLFAKIRLSSLNYINSSIQFPAYDSSKTIEHEIYLDCEKRYGRVNPIQGKVKAIIFPEINSVDNRVTKVSFEQKKKELFREIISQQTTVIDNNLIELYKLFKKIPLYEAKITADVSNACEMLLNEML